MNYKKIFLINTILIAGIVAINQYCSFDSAQLIRVIPKTQKHIEELIRVTKLEFVLVDYRNFFKDPLDLISPIINVSRINSPSLYFTRVETALFFQQYCRNLGMDTEIVIENVQRDLIKLDSNQLMRRDIFKEGMDPRNFNITQYHSWTEIYAFMKELQIAYPHLCSVINIGETSERRPMHVLKIGSGKNAIWIDSTIHAREWITTTIATYLAYNLIIGYDKYPEMRKLVDDITWYILPIFNVDGYAYSWDTDRMWRKNRSLDPKCRANARDPVCYCHGVDLNRNWDISWNTTYTCQHPCCHTYPGKAPMSEPEVRNVANFLRKNDGHIKSYVSLHNYGQMWTYPYAHSYKLYQREVSKIRELAELAAKALANTHGNVYSVSSLSDVMLRAAGSGVSTDWVVDNTNITFAYLIEVRPTMDNGHFCLDETEIRPAGEELFSALKVIANYLSGNINLTGKYDEYYNSNKSGSFSRSKNLQPLIGLYIIWIGLYLIL